MSHCWQSWLLTLAKAPAGQVLQIELPLYWATLPGAHAKQEVEALLLL